ncbi:hypothetical protein SCAR479_07716 [Seiridium cardinale]|uniref:Uncharacterized protein n=1 Tax=Seiridium cardinale TaxID=138064 RepID=A0ABR2XP72_9PEZI
MEDAEQELKRRRERGRIAQAEFRKRQVKAAQETQHENERLREALISIARIARPDDRAELVAVIKKAAGASGINVEHLEQTNTQSVSYKENPPSNEQALDPRLANYSESFDSKPSTSLSMNSAQKQVAVARQPEQSSKPAFKAPRCMMWLNPMRFMRIDDPPEDIIPFLGPGSQTLAGKLFWTVMEHARSECHHAHELKTPEDCNQNPCFRRMIDHSMATRSISHGFMKAMAEARLEYRQLGYISSEYASAADADTGAVMKRRVLEDYMMRGQDASIWLNPFAVEARARTVLGPRGFTMFENATRSPENSPLHTLLATAIETLIASFVCFGDGPRWSIQVVDKTFSQWLEKVRR